MKYLILFTLLISATINADAQIPDSLPSDGLEAWYPLNGNANDESGNGLNGTNMGATPAMDRHGNENAAMSFVGTLNGGDGDHILLPDFPWNEWNAYSMSMWLNIDEVYGDGEHFFNVGTLWPHAMSIQQSINGNLSYRVSDEAPGYSVNTSGLFDPFSFGGTWLHLLFTNSNTDGLKAYLNGELIGTDEPYPGTIDYAAGYTALAKHWWNDGASSSTKFNGQIDDVAFYSRELSVVEVASIYDPASQNICDNQPQGIAPNTGGWEYNDFIVPAGYRVDSIYADFNRPGYPAATQDFAWSFCPNCTQFNGPESIAAFAYSEVDTSLYDGWIELTAFEEFVGPGIARALAPTNAGVEWIDFCYALSPVETEYPTCFPSYLSEDGLVAWYPFCGNANDGSGNNLNGVVEGPNLVSDRNGEPNSAYFFNGTGNIIEVEHNDLLNFQAGGELTVSYWIQGTPDPSNVDHTISKQTGSGSNQDGWNCALQQNTSEPAFILKNGSGSNQCLLNSGETALADEWYNVVSVYNGSLIRIYMNGVLTSETECVTEIGDNTNSLQIGSCTWATTFPNVVSFTGVIDDIAIYNRALTYFEVSEMFDGSFTDCVPSYLPTNELVAWYPFCGDASDQSGNNLDGTVQGAALIEDRFGDIESAYSFDGIDDHILIPDNDLLDFGPNNFSVSYWVKKIGLSQNGNSQGVNKWYDGSSPVENEWNLSIGADSSEEPLFGIETDQGQYTVVSSEPLNLSTWTNITGVRNEDFILIYVNGQLRGSELVGNAVMNNIGRDLLIGTIQAGLVSNEENLFSNACFDDIAIYSRALTPNEISSISQGVPLNICDDCTDNYRSGDLDCDGQVSSSDLLIFLAAYGGTIE
jgi:hypothetical protein